VIHRLDRFEMKFVITLSMRERLMPRLMPHLRADENAGESAYYPIVSLYYDTPDRDCYWEKVSGLKSRRKLRVRVYGSLDGTLPPTSFVEIKHKIDGRNVKRRARMALEDALIVAAGENLSQPLGFAEQRVVNEIHRLVHDRGFAPCVCMRYDRNAFMALDPSSDLRITFDSGIAYRFDNLMPVPDDRNYQHYINDPDTSVMEVKVTGSVPYWLTMILAETGCILQSHSKYCRALEAGDPVVRQVLRGSTAALAAV
jgi:hypothetical protein